MTLKNKGRSKKTEGRTRPKARVVVWQWVPTFREAVPPPPPRIQSPHSDPSGSAVIFVLTFIHTEQFSD